MKGCREIQGEGDTFWKIISCQRHRPLLGLISRKGCCCPWSLPLPGRTAYLTCSLYFILYIQDEVLTFWLLQSVNRGIWVPSLPETLLIFKGRIALYKNWACHSVVAVRARLSWGSLLALCRCLRHPGLQIEMVPRRLFWGVRGSQEFSVLRWIETTYSRREGLAHREGIWTQLIGPFRKNGLFIRAVHVYGEETDLGSGKHHVYSVSSHTYSGPFRLAASESEPLAARVLDHTK